MPTTDVLLLALLVAVGSILGARLDRTLFTVGCRACAASSSATSSCSPAPSHGTLRRRRPAGAHLADRRSAWPPLAAHRARPQPPQDARAALPRRLAAARAPAGLQRGQPRRAGRGLGRRHAGRGRLAGDRLRARRHRPHRRHLPRGSRLQRGQAAGPHRRAHRPAQPPGAARGGPADARRRAAARPAGRPAAARPRRLQGGQRQPRATTPATTCSRQIGPRLRPALRPGDLLARLGGDEFAVLLPDVGAATRREALRRPAARAGARSRSPSRASGCTSASASASPAPRFRPPRSQELLRCADVAMYAAKAAPRRACTSTCPTRTAAPATGCGTMEELRTALEATTSSSCTSSRRWACADGRVVGAEALVRWHHPTRGLLSPADLLPAAEQAGLLRPLDRRGARAGAHGRRPLVAGRARCRCRSTCRRPTSPTSTCPARWPQALAATACPPGRSPSSWSRTRSWPIRSGAARCWASSAGSASARRSTTTAPATARWPTCGTCPPTSSSSTGA